MEPPSITIAPGQVVSTNETGGRAANCLAEVYNFYLCTARLHIVTVSHARFTTPTNGMSALNQLTVHFYTSDQIVLCMVLCLNKWMPALTHWLSVVIQYKYLPQCKQLNSCQKTWLGIKRSHWLTMMTSFSLFALSDTSLTAKELAVKTQ